MANNRHSTANLRAVQRSLRPTPNKLAPIGRLMVQQVRDRFASQGASGGVKWPNKRFDDGRAVLTGRMSTLLKSFTYAIEQTETRAVIRLFSTEWYGIVHQLGTVGKGGKLKTIVPKRAKALFIPLTDRAKTSTRYGGKEAVEYRQKTRMDATGGAVRAATTGRVLRSGVRSALKPGKFVDGKLCVQNRDGEWEPGHPDFIFARKVDIPPRPMLPTSKGEQASQRALVATVYGTREREGRAAE